MSASAEGSSPSAILDRVWRAAADASTSSDLDGEGRERYRRSVLADARLELLRWADARVDLLRSADDQPTPGRPVAPAGFVVLQRPARRGDLVMMPSRFGVELGTGVDLTGGPGRVVTAGDGWAMVEFERWGEFGCAIAELTVVVRAGFLVPLAQGRRWPAASGLGPAPASVVTVYGGQLLDNPSGFVLGEWVVDGRWMAEAPVGHLEMMDGVGFAEAVDGPLVAVADLEWARRVTPGVQIVVRVPAVGREPDPVQAAVRASGGVIPAEVAASESRPPALEPCCVTPVAGAGVVPAQEVAVRLPGPLAELAARARAGGLVDVARQLVAVLEGPPGRRPGVPLRWYVAKCGFGHRSVVAFATVNPARVTTCPGCADGRVVDGQLEGPGVDLSAVQVRVDRVRSMPDREPADATAAVLRRLLLQVTDDVEVLLAMEQGRRAAALPAGATAVLTVIPERRPRSILDGLGLGPGEGTWECMICGEERSDAAVSVAAERPVVDSEGVIGQVNVRYCNDRQGCALMAWRSEPWPTAQVWPAAPAGASSPAS